MHPRELGWLAGFLEGEGSFSGPRGNTRVVAWQVQAEPLEHVQRLIGGKIRYLRRHTAKAAHSDVHTWWITGPHARGVMMTVYSLMSPKRQGQILEALAYWRAAIPQGKVTECIHGHMYTPENTYTYADGRRACRTCLEARSRQAAAKRLEERHEQYELVWEQKAEWSKTHCAHGHERTPENTYTVPQSGRKVCRLCRLQQKKDSHERTYVPIPRVKPTHCPHGHEYTEENSYFIPSTGIRMCRACNRERGRNFHKNARPTQD